MSDTPPDKYFTREEAERMFPNIIARLEKIEHLCFDDELDGAGKIIRPSLQTVLYKLNNHIDAMRDYLSIAWLILKWGGAIGGLALILRAFGYL